MNSEKSCADYFRSRPEYRRCFETLWKKWRSYGRTAGKIVLDDASEEECRAIGGITGKRYLDDRIVFSFSEFEQGLQKTRFAPVDIKKLLEIYFGKTLVSRGEQEKEEQIRQSSFFSRCTIIFRKGNSRCRCVGLAAEAGRRKKLWTFHFMPGIQKRSGAGTCSGRVCRNSTGTDPCAAEDERRDPAGGVCSRNFRKSTLL